MRSWQMIITVARGRLSRRYLCTSGTSTVQGNGGRDSEGEQKSQKAVSHWFHKTGQNLKDCLPIILNVSIFNNFVAFIYFDTSVCLYVYASFLWACAVQDNLSKSLFPLVPICGFLWSEARDCGNHFICWVITTVYILTLCVCVCVTLFICTFIFHVTYLHFMFVVPKRN